MGPPSISVVYTAECHLFEQCPECAATPMASAARTVEADDIWKKNKISPSGCFYIATTVSSYCVLMKDCKVSFFKSAFNFSLKSKTASSASATLKYSQIIHGDLPSREKAFLFLWIFCFKKDSSLEMSFDDILKVSRYLIVENLEMWPQFCFGDCIWCLQLGTGLREIHLSCPNHCFCRTTCTWRHFTSKNRSSAPKNWKQLRTKNVQLSLSWKRNMSPIVRSRPSTN